MKKTIMLSFLIISLLLTASMPVFSGENGIENNFGDDERVVCRNTNEVLYRIDCMQPYDESYYSHYIPPTEEILSRSYPSSIDLSSLSYFPDHSLVQGSIGSCVAFSTIYFQFNYEVNKCLGVPASTTDPYSPTWGYYWCNQNNLNEGVAANDIYDFLATHGSFHLSDDPYTGVFNSNYQFPTVLKQDKLLEALKTRISNYAVLTIPTGSSSISSPSSSKLNQVKYYLSNNNMRKVLRVSSSWSFDYANVGTTTNPELVMYRFRQSAEGHSFVVVGYDDNYEYDVNNNGIIEPAEKGAFKIVNSWDMGPAYVGASSGPVFEAWVLYDALNLNSCISGNWEDNLPGTRCPAFDDDLDNYSNSNVFNYITAINHYDGIYYISKIEVLPPSNGICEVDYLYKFSTSNVFMGKGKVSIPYRTDEYYIIYQDYNHSYSGYGTSPSSSITVSMPSDLTGFKWGFYMFCGTAFRKTLIDDLGNKIATMVSANTVSGKTCYEATINLQKGDLNYDGSLTDADLTKLSQFIAGSTDFSTLQKYLADLNDDGNINMRDYMLLMSLI